MTTSKLSTDLLRIHEKNQVSLYNGLRNQGATCYLNAVLQCLFMTPEFRDAVQSYEKVPEDCSEENLLLQLQKVFTQLSVNVATTKGITRNLGIRNVFEQQDAVEYYRKLLKAVGPHISEVFEGKMNNITKCTLCNSISRKTNSFISILLPIRSSSNEQNIVNEGLETFFKHSRLDQDDWLYCDSCDQKTETVTWSEMEACPAVLTLQLKRFDFDYMQMRFVKNSCALDVPLILHIENNTYHLYAVINHMGGYSSGHYDAVIRSYQNQKWYRFDDSIVTESDASLQGSRLPYMLMYRKEQKLSKTAVLSPTGSDTEIHLRVLLLGSHTSEKSSVGNLILHGENYPTLSSKSSETVIKESTAQTVGNHTVVDTPHLFSLTPVKWAKEVERCVTLCQPGPNVILWVTPISRFSEHQQGLFNNIKKRLGSAATKHMMIIFTNGEELESLEQTIQEFISKHNKIKKVVSRCQKRYCVIDSRNQTRASELTQHLCKIVTENRHSYWSFKKTIRKAKTNVLKNVTLSCISTS